LGIYRNGIDTKHFKKNDNCIKNDKFLILFHGLLGKFQDIDLLLQYAKFLKDNNIEDIKIKIIGDGIKKADAEKFIVDNNGINSLLEVSKIIKNSDLPLQINRAHLGISPRIQGLISKTAFPVKIYEFIGCGLPVIVSPVSEGGDFAEEHNFGFQFSGSRVNELHKYVLKLKNDKRLYAQMSDNAVLASKKFDRKKIANKLLKTIIKTVKN